MSEFGGAPLRDREWLAIAGVTLISRVLVFLACLWHGHWRVADYTARGDTSSYIAVADAMSGGRSYASLLDYDRRVFPGYPAMVAVVHKLGVPLELSPLVVTWLSAAIAAVMAGIAFADARVGWAMTCLVPHYLMNSSLGMSEAPVLAMTLLALLASQYKQHWMAGICLGIAGLTRPMAVFAAVGIFWMLIRDKRRSGAVVTLLCAAGAFLVGIGAMQLWTGDVLHGVHVYHDHPGAYAGHLLQWPFQSLLVTPRREPTSVGRMIYIWVHVVIVLGAVGIAMLRSLKRGERSKRSDVSFPWLAGNTAFALCVGEPWGFRHFPRFTIPASPALFWTLRRWLPRRPGWWVLINLALIWPSVIGILNSPT